MSLSDHQCCCFTKSLVQPSALCQQHQRTTLWAKSLKAHWFYCIWNKIWSKAASHRTVSLGKQTFSVLCYSYLYNSDYIVILLLQSPSLFREILLSSQALNPRSRTLHHNLQIKILTVDPCSCQRLINTAIWDVGLVGSEEREKGTVSICLSQQ